MSKSELNKEFYDRIVNIYKQSDIDIVYKGFEAKRKPNFRVNSLKTTEKELLKELEKSKIKPKKFHELKNSYILEKETENEISKLDVYKDGKLYFQNIASQVPVSFLNLKEGQNVLDVTAAPGSKTTQISADMNNTGKIYANEIDKIRYERLKYNLDLMECSNVETINSDARRLSERFAPESFNRILADLPCSAEGRIHLKNHKSFMFWNERNITKHSKLQKSILKEVIPLLKKGGEIVYSTCTIAPEENEDIVSWILENYPDMRLGNIDMEYKYIRRGIVSFGDKKYSREMEKTIRCLPSDVTEGFYVAKIRKK